MSNKHSRLMNQKEDYEKLHINPHVVEQWEDGQRETWKKNRWEWWYFDAMLDDGSVVVIQFLAKSAAAAWKNTAQPTIIFQITLPDGTKYEERPTFPVHKCSHSKEKCDVRYEQNYFRGNLKDYEIHMEPINGIAADLKLHSLTQPYRPGSGYISFDETDQKYYTWLCVVPKGEVTGTIMVNGESKQVHGFGYHDHQWGSFVFALKWNNWTWARQSYDDYTMLVFDMVTVDDYGNKRYPLCFIQNASGEIIFSNTDTVEYKVYEEFFEEKSQKTYPKVSSYKFTQGNDTVEYKLTCESVIHCDCLTARAPKLVQGIVAKKGLNPSYCRFIGTGELKMNLQGETVERKAPLIYEFMFPGKKYH